MYEKRLKAVPSQLFTADGGADGKVKVADSSLFKVKQEVFVSATSLVNLELEVKQIDDATTIYLGPRRGNINTRENLTTYTVALGAAIAANEQKRPSVPAEEITRAVYEEEPTVAMRSSLVDTQGNKYSVDNPFPVQLSDGNINIDNLNAEIMVQLDHVDQPGKAHDSVRVGDGTNEMSVNSDKSINTRTTNKLIATPHDTIVIAATNPAGDPTQILFKKGGLTGTVVQTLDLVYVNGNLQSVTRSPNEN